MATVAQKRRPARALRWACIALAICILGGCVLVPRPGPMAEEVFRNASGETVELPEEWEWAR